MNEPFTEDIIKHYLAEKLYEKRGISKEEYVARCKKLWDETNSEEAEYKIIIDGLYEYSNFEEKKSYLAPGE